MIDEKEQSERSSKIMNAGVEAQSILEHPMISEFFKTQTTDAVNAFANLPDDATLNDYKAVHMRFKTLNTLQTKLQGYIRMAQDEELQLKRTEDQAKVSI
jgi:hypothetical protein